MEYKENSYWWDPELDPDQRAKALWEHVRALEENQATVHSQNLINARLYSNRELSAFDWGHNEVVTGTLEPVSRASENLVLSIVDTMTSNLAKQKVKATVITKDADYTTTRKAELLDRALYGEQLRNKVFLKAVLVARDIFLFGFGVWELCIEEGNLCIDRVFPDEIIVDHTECISNPKPLNVFRRQVLPVEGVIAAYAADDEELADRIRAQAGQRAYTSYRWPGDGYVVVTEGYHRSVCGNPGRHTISIRDVPLLDEAWPFDWFPYVWVQYQPPITGFYSPSAVEVILPYQLRLNEINQVIRDAQDLMARPRLLVANGSQVNLQALDNRIARVINYTGTKPEAINWTAVSAELYNERDRLVRNAFEFFGLSQLEGLQRLPAGARLDSAPALREATAKNDDRFASLSELWEGHYLELAERMVDMCSAYSKGWGSHPAQKLKTNWRGRNKVGDFDWADLDLDRDRYVMELGASSVLNQTPAAREDQVMTWFSLGLIPPNRVLELLQHPDLEAETSIVSASHDDIMDTIEQLVEGEEVYPTPLQDLVNGVMLVTAAYFKTKAQLRKDKTVSQAKKNQIERGFVRWINAARSTLDKTKKEEAAMNPPPMPMPAPGAPAPMPAPMPPQ